MIWGAGFLDSDNAARTLVRLGDGIAKDEPLTSIVDDVLDTSEKQLKSSERWKRLAACSEILSLTWFILQRTDPTSVPERLTKVVRRIIDKSIYVKAQETKHDGEIARFQQAYLLDVLEGCRPFPGDGNIPLP